MSEMGTFDEFSSIKSHHLEISRGEPSAFEESFRMVMPLLHFVNFHPGNLETIFDQSWRFVNEKCACLKNCKIMKIWLNLQFPEGYANFSGSAGGRSLAPAAFLAWCEAF